MTKRNFIIAELLILCVLIPGVIIGFRLAPFMFAFLWGATGYCWIILKNHYKETMTHLWKWKEVTLKNLNPILMRWVLASIGMYFFTLWYDSERLFNLFHYRPEIIPFLMVGYPLISALPQEFVFCSFFFARYESLFKNTKLLIFMSALTFAYAHCLYINPIAPTLSFLGGIIFASTYAKTKSLALVTIEHGLYGISLFIIGLGWYFYSGAVPTG
jgi:hypothetical protein